MKVKKLQKILTYVGFAGIILAFLLLNIAPLVEGDGFEFVGIVAFGQGFLSLFSFNFASAPVVLLFFLFFITLVCLAGWFVAIFKGQQKEGEKRDIVTPILAFVTILFAFIIYSAVFAAITTFNGEEVILYDGMNRVAGHGFGKFLTMFAVALSHISVMSFTLIAFTQFEKYIKEEVK